MDECEFVGHVTLQGTRLRSIILVGTVERIPCHMFFLGRGGVRASYTHSFSERANTRTVRRLVCAPCMCDMSTLAALCARICAAHKCQKRPMYMAKEADLYGKRDLCIWQKRPMYLAKETYVYGKRGLLGLAYLCKFMQLHQF